LIFSADSVHYVVGPAPGLVVSLPLCRLSACTRILSDSDVIWIRISVHICICYFCCPCRHCCYCDLNAVLGLYGIVVSSGTWSVVVIRRTFPTPLLILLLIHISVCRGVSLETFGACCGIALAISAPAGAVGSCSRALDVAFGFLVIIGPTCLCTRFHLLDPAVDYAGLRRIIRICIRTDLYVLLDERIYILECMVP
jgi:hypothetical protein